MEPRALAEKANFGGTFVAVDVTSNIRVLNLSIVLASSSGIDSRKLNEYLHSVALLSCPGAKLVPENVAVVARATDGSLRIAIICQKARMMNRRPELYVYDIPETVRYGQCSSAQFTAMSVHLFSHFPLFTVSVSNLLSARSAAYTQVAASIA